MNAIKKTFLAKAFCLSLLLSPLTSHAVTGWYYTITVNGIVLNASGTAFSKTGALVLFSPLTTTGERNGVNPLDAALATGNVYSTSPTAGSLNFVTNSRLAPLTGYYSNAFVKSQLDLVYSSWANNCLTFQPDQTIAQAITTTSPNAFIARTSLTAPIYYAQTGPIKLCTNDNFQTFTGTIGLMGSSFYSSLTPTVTYSATVTAKFVGTRDFAI